MRSVSQGNRIETKINKGDLIKPMQNLHRKETIKNKKKRQPMEWEKIVANNEIYKG